MKTIPVTVTNGMAAFRQWQIALRSTFLLSLLSFYSFSQSVNYLPGKTIYGSLTSDGFAKIDVYIHNNTSDSLDIGWELLANNLASGWDYSLCDYGTCYPGIPAGGKMKRMGINDTAFLKINLSGMDIVGTGTVDFVVKPTQTESDTIHFIISTYVASVPDNYTEQKFVVSPNPAADFVSVQLNNISNSKIIFTNILGETVKQETLFNKRNVISLSELPEGLYFASLHNNGQIIETKKIVVSNR